MAEGREMEGLQALGAKTKYSQDYDPSVQETFINWHQDNDYWVQFNCPPACVRLQGSRILPKYAFPISLT